MASSVVRQRFLTGINPCPPQKGKRPLLRPNLTWRRKGRILINPLSYVASEEDLNRLSFNDFPLLKNYPTYIRYIGQPFYVKGFPRRKIFGCIH